LGVFFLRTESGRVVFISREMRMKLHQLRPLIQPDRTHMLSLPMHSRCFSLLCTFAAAVFLSSCATDSSITLDYVPPAGGVSRGAPEFSVGAFANKRGLNSSYLGTVKLPVGVPIEHLNTKIPIETVVANAFAHALEHRGMLATADKARFLVTGDVIGLHAELLVHPYASAEIRMNVVEVGSGRVLFSRVYFAERQSAAYRPGSGSPLPILQQLTSRALQDAVDQAVDDPAMRSQLAGGGSFKPRYTPGML
jgi:hypothetical protein